MKSEKAADRVLKSISSWIERKLFLKVRSTKSKVVRPTKSQYLGFTFVKMGGNWTVKSTNEKKAKFKKTITEYLKRNKACACSIKETFTRLNQMIKGWINYFRIGAMKIFMKDFGTWLRHKVRVIIIK